MSSKNVVQKPVSYTHLPPPLFLSNNHVGCIYEIHDFNTLLGLLKGTLQSMLQCIQYTLYLCPIHERFEHELPLRCMVGYLKHNWLFLHSWRAAVPQDLILFWVTISFTQSVIYCVHFMYDSNPQRCVWKSPFSFLLCRALLVIC